MNGTAMINGADCRGGGQNGERLQQRRCRAGRVTRERWAALARGAAACRLRQIGSERGRLIRMSVAHRDVEVVRLRSNAVIDHYRECPPSAKVCLDAGLKRPRHRRSWFRSASPAQRPRRASINADAAGGNAVDLAARSIGSNDDVEKGRHHVNGLATPAPPIEQC
jgi:hypothetical protein